jgi:predicted nucleic acid-binding protein
VIVVSDSSPLITLSRAEHLDLLREFYQRIAISSEVYDEVTVAGAGLPGADEVQNADWIQVDPAQPSRTNRSKPPALGLESGSEVPSTWLQRLPPI